MNNIIPFSQNQLDHPAKIILNVYIDKLNNNPTKKEYKIIYDFIYTMRNSGGDTDMFLLYAKISEIEQNNIVAKEFNKIEQARKFKLI